MIACGGNEINVLSRERLLRDLLKDYCCVSSGVGSKGSGKDGSLLSIMFLSLSSNQEKIKDRYAKLEVRFP